MSLLANSVNILKTLAIHFKFVNCMIYELYFNEAVMKKYFKMKGRTDTKNRKNLLMEIINRRI